MDELNTAVYQEKLKKDVSSLKHKDLKQRIKYTPEYLVGVLT